MVTTNMYRQFGGIWTCGFEICERTDKHTNTLTTILRTPNGIERSNE